MYPWTYAQPLFLCCIRLPSPSSSSYCTRHRHPSLPSSSCLQRTGCSSSHFLYEWTELCVLGRPRPFRDRLGFFWDAIRPIYFSGQIGKFVDKKNVNKIKYIVDLFLNVCFARFTAPNTIFLDDYFDENRIRVGSILCCKFCCGVLRSGTKS